MSYKHYSLGFCFDVAKERVALIEKINPEWQKGLLNGVGGKLERYETYAEAMAREFVEETGVGESINWKRIGTINGPTWECGVFAAFDDVVYAVRTVTPETVHLGIAKEFLEEPKYKLVPNLKWMIPFCMYRQDGELFNVKY